MRLTSSENAETGEKNLVDVDVAHSHPSSKEEKPGFFARLFNKKSSVDDTRDERKKDEDKKEPEIPPVPFRTLFRYSTKFELMLNFVGLIAAVAAGSTQPLMTILFGKLTNEFINFQTVLHQIDAGVLQKSALEEVAAEFRRTSSKLAAYLVCMGALYFIKEGRVSEVGTHDQLFARRGDYYAYVQLQSLINN